MTGVTQGNFDEVMKKQSTELTAKLKVEAQWFRWYEILTCYFPESKSGSESAGQNLVIVFHALGWAGLTATYLSGKGHWLLWGISSLVIASSFLYAFRFMYTSETDPGYKLSARLLAAIMMRGGGKADCQ